MKNIGLTGIPERVKSIIIAEDDARRNKTNYTRYYSYMTMWRGEVSKITVAVKTKGIRTKNSTAVMKQVAVHSINGKAYERDMVFTYLGGYQVNWGREIENYISPGQGEWVKIEPKYYDPYAILVDYQELGIKYKYSALEKCANACISEVEYLKALDKQPELERLMKCGLGYLCLKKSITSKCGDKQFVGFLKHNIEFITKHVVPADVIVRAYNNNTSIEKLYEEHNDSVWFRRWEKSNIHYEDILKTLKPYAKQIKAYVNQLGYRGVSYADYIGACGRIGVNLSDTKNLFPHDFDYWHNMRTAQYETWKTERDEKLKKESIALFKALVEKYKSLTLDAEYKVLLAKDKQELINEGNILHHCVGRMDYDRKMLNEESLIFFIRKPEEPEVPFVTVEFGLDKGIVRQCYGVHDTRPSQEVRDFVSKWERRASKALDSIKKAA